jgi:hemerythrin
MDWIGWDETLDTGHAGMDADHKQLAGLFSRLRDALANGEGNVFCFAILDDIIRHTREHFELEQCLMLQHRYPKAEQHAAEHAMLIRQAMDFRNSFDADASRPAQMRFADVWLAFHILFSDKELAAFLARARSGQGKP